MAKKATKRFLSADTYISMALGLAVVLLVGSALFNFLSKRSAPSNNNEQTSTDSAHVSVPMIHRVQENDSLWTIAIKYYDNGYNWVDIQKANNLSNPDNLAVGEVLTIPAVAKQTGSVDELAATVTSKPLHDSVTVVKGESLWTIALREYGNPYRWTDIAKTNNLANPDIIHAGNVLRLP